MSERDELAEFIRKTDEANEWDPSPRMYGKYADAILAAGYRKLRIITTAEELDALPVQSVIRDAEDYVWERFGSGPASWDCAGVPDWESHLIALPATVLWEPR